jgi:DNA polymerase-3 subunit alpha
MLRTANDLADSKTSGQASLFGGGDGDSAHMAADETLRLAMERNAGWSLAQTMAQEKDAFGFYFSSHPVEQWRHLTQAQGVVSYAAVCGSGERRGSAMLAGLVEEARWRTPQSGRGGRYLLVTVSDPGGQWMASCFDEDIHATIEAAARSGDPCLISAELQWRPGEEQPRVTIRGLTPLAELAKRSRSRLTLDLAHPDAIPDLARKLDGVRGGRGEVHARVTLPGGRFARIALGKEFAIDAEVQTELARIRGVLAATLTAVEGNRTLA